MIGLVCLIAHLCVVNEMKLTKSHIGEEEKSRAVYICTHTYHVLNGSEEERIPHARAAAVRPARRGLGLGLGLGLGWRAFGLIRTIFFGPS